MQKSPIRFTEHGIPIRNLWHMLLYAWNEPSVERQVSMGDVEDAPTLDALLAILLIKFLEQRMRTGLGHGYVERSQQIRAVRGRVNIPKSIKGQTFLQGAMVCDFQQYSADEPRNQVIRSTLTRLVQSGEFGPDPVAAEALRHRLRWTVRNLGAVQFIPLTVDLIRRLALAQNDSEYRLMLSICELIALRQMPLETEGTQPLPRLDHELLTLHRIYERFVANFYRMHLTGWDVSAQKRLDWHAGEANEHLPSMIPDLVLQNRDSGEIIILDTKFTAGSLVENPWGKPVYDSSHLYQLYAYLRSQEQVSAAHQRAVGILLYPAVQARLSESVQLQGHVIRIESVDLAAAWEDVEKQLMGVIG